MTVTADPRLRARKLAVAREAGHRRLLLLSAGLSAVAVVVSALVLLHSSLLSARVVHLRGAVHETRAQVLAVTGLGAHPPLADIPTAADAAALERLPWVRSAQVVDDWPTGVTVTLTEREPVAYVALPGRRAALVDPTGRVLSAVAGVPTGLVALAHVGTVGAPGTRLTAARAALRVATRLPSSLASRVAALQEGSSGVELRLASGPTVELGGLRSLGAKMTALATILAKVPLHGIVTIDLRIPSQPLLTR